MKKKTNLNNYARLSSAIAVIAMLFLRVPSTQAAACLQLDSDLSYGMTDPTTNGPILLLQEYLESSGYLAAAPNGHFGPATLSAVEVFQTVNGISSTGYVGPQTRAAISQKTCVSNPSAQPSISPVPTAAQAAPSTAAYPPSSPLVGVTRPAGGEVIPIGSNYVISWSASSLSAFNIVLEQPSGAGAGFVGMDVSSNSGSQYLWKVGTAFSSQTQSSQTVATGTYRIRLENPSTGAEPSDETSGWFTLTAPQSGIVSVTPTSAYADNSTSIVVYGSGFTPSTSVYFDTNLYGTRAQNAYISPDGTVLVFTIPTTVSVGLHTLFISDSFDSAPISWPFTVNAVQ